MSAKKKRKPHFLRIFDEKKGKKILMLRVFFTNIDGKKNI